MIGTPNSERVTQFESGSGGKIVFLGFGEVREKDKKQGESVEEAVGSLSSHEREFIELSKDFTHYPRFEFLELGKGRFSEHRQ